ncbi:MAG: GNAT family N-acetyltransferase [Acidimicrobiales bacterium]
MSSVRSEAPIELRRARPDDLDGIADLLAARGEPADAVDLRLVAADPDEGLDHVFVATAGERVVATATLLRETVRLGGVDLPAGQVELVATDPEFEGRGLIRSLMAMAHERSHARGDLLQVMIGIPYFYRQFGYVYSMPIPLTRSLRADADIGPDAGADGVTVREAGVADIPAMHALQERTQSAVEVSMPHSPGCWRWLVARDGSSQWVAEADGRVVATARALPPEEGMVLGEVAGDPTGVRALLRHARGLSDSVDVMDRDGTPEGALLEPLLTPEDDPDAARHWYYLRVARVAPLLEALRPVLGRRWLEAGGDGRDPAEVLVSSYRSHVRFRLDGDGMGPVAAGGALQAPVSNGGSGVPPDVIGPLLFGPHGAAGLERRHADVLLGRQRELMTALFPPVRADLLTFYLPI